MGYEEQLTILHQGVEAWNTWYSSQPEETRIDLSEEDLSGTNLSGAQIKQLAQTTEATQSHALTALSIYRIDTALLHALQPDVIFTQTQCEVCAVSERDVIEALHHVTGLHPRIVSLAPYRLEDVWEDVLRVGEALARQHEAGELVSGYTQRLTELAQRTSQLSAKQGHRPTVAVLEWLDPLMGAGNWVPELIQYAGGEPSFGDVKVSVGALIVVAISCLLLGAVALIPSPILLIAGVILFAGAGGLVENVLRGLTSRMAAQHEQGRVAGASQSLGSLAAILAPLLGGVIYTQWGHFEAYSSGALIAVLAIISVFAAIPALRGQEASR